MAGETKNDFYEFGMMMAKDSELLYKNDRLHNSVYFAVFALEAYLKMKLIIHEVGSYYGHIHEERFINRVIGVEPDIFTLDDFNNMRNNYNINDRYLVDEWTDNIHCANVQDELGRVKNLLMSLQRGIDL